MRVQLRTVFNAMSKPKTPRAPKKPRVELQVVPPSYDEEALFRDSTPPAADEVVTDYARLVEKLNNGSAQVHFSFHLSNGDSPEVAYDKVAKVFQ